MPRSQERSEVEREPSPKKRQKASAEAFLIRLWREPGQSEAAEVRGSVRQLRTGEQRHFASLDSLDTYLLSSLDAGRGRN